MGFAAPSQPASPSTPNATTIPIFLSRLFFLYKKSRSR
jgi:hypothetical protein